jgi:hypothetical protein
MRSDRRFTGTARFLQAHWPAYAWRYAVLVLGLVLLALGISTTRPLIGIAGAIFSVLGALALLIGLQQAHQLFDANGERLDELLLDWSQLSAMDSIGLIDLGTRQAVRTLGSRLTQGILYVIDIYNPQLGVSSAIARQRQRAPHALLDPRLRWYASPIDLLPLPDCSLHALFIPYVLAEIAQRGDRLTLLHEAYRVLKPEGRLLVSERPQSWKNWLLFAPGGPNLEAPEYWTNLISACGFTLRRQENYEDLVLLVRADRPSPFAGEQLPLGLSFVE